MKAKRKWRHQQKSEEKAELSQESEEKVGILIGK